jgi:hypothetical protein
MPDKWDEIAEKVLHEIAMNTARGDRTQSATFFLSQALRDAERAGMERAARICERLKPPEGPAVGFQLPWCDGTDACADAIRAAKETKP